MIAADDDRRGQLAPGDHFVERQSQAMTVAEADPTDARRQPLEVNPLARHVEPVMQMAVSGQQLAHLGIGAVDVLRIA